MDVLVFKIQAYAQFKGTYKLNNGEPGHIYFP